MAELRSPESRDEPRELLSQLPGLEASRLARLASRSPGLESKPLKMGVGIATELGILLPASAQGKTFNNLSATHYRLYIRHRSKDNSCAGFASCMPGNTSEVKITGLSQNDSKTLGSLP